MVDPKWSNHSAKSGAHRRNTHWQRLAVQFGADFCAQQYTEWGIVSIIMFPANDSKSCATWSCRIGKGIRFKMGKNEVQSRSAIASRVFHRAIRVSDCCRGHSSELDWPLQGGRSMDRCVSVERPCRTPRCPRGEYIHRRRGRWRVSDPQSRIPPLCSDPDYGTRFRWLLRRGRRRC